MVKQILRCSILSGRKIGDFNACHMKDKYNHAHIVFILHHFIMLGLEYFSVIRQIIYLSNLIIQS